MFQQIETQIAAAVEAALREKFNLQQSVALEQPKQTSFGEIAIPVAFQLARQLKRPPRQIAEELAPSIQAIPGVAAVEVAGNGYLNVRLNRVAYMRQLAQPTSAPLAVPGKIVVEHTNINPNKAAHIGHLRNAILGDTFVRMLRTRGRTVEIQNYIDNTGVQVADVAVAFHHLQGKSAAEVSMLANDPGIRFDYLCWDLYASMSAYYEQQPEALGWRSAALHAIESNNGEIAALAAVIADAIVRLHLATMRRLGIVYDVLPRESEILHLQFWATAFELLKERNAIYLETAGKNSGCWVMPSAAFRTGVETGDENDDNKVIVRSNGTVTYVGKDIAYQLWKFGLLGKDFFYRVWEETDVHTVWVTTDHPTGNAPHPAFGHAAQVFNVIDSRQSYLQDVVVAGLRALHFDAEAERSTHFSYEMVALTPRTCVEMGIELSEENRRRPYVEVSGRKGLGVKADDLIDKLIETASREVADRHAEASEAECRSVAGQVAIGALRYFMLKFTRNSVIAFDFQEALSFEGETGPYVQYAAVRAGRILAKHNERADGAVDLTAAMTEQNLSHLEQNETVWQSVLLASKLESSLERAINAGEPAHVAKYAFQLAQEFNNFYRDVPVLNEPNPELRAAYLWVTAYLRDQLSNTLAVLGISVPPYM